MVKAFSWLWSEGVWKFVLFFLVFGVFVVLVRQIVPAFVSSYSLPMLALLGVVTMLGTLLIFTALLNLIGLSDQTQALGLPEGSVRALLALALLGLFAVLASSVLGKPELRTFSQLSSDDVVALIRNNPEARDLVQVAGPEGKYTVHFYSPLRQDESSKQILTLVGTLMTAVIAFYFGTASMRAPNDISRAPPELSGVEPETKLPTTDPVTLKLQGNNLNSIRVVRLTEASKAVELEAHTVLSNPSRVTCTFAAHPALATDGTWDVTVVDDIGRTATKKGGLPVKVATAGPATSAPLLNNISPGAAPKDVANDYTISGSGLDAVTTVEAVPATGGSAVAAQILSKTPTEVKCRLTLAAGSWTVRITPGTVSANAGRLTIA